MKEIDSNQKFHSLICTEGGLIVQMIQADISRGMHSELYTILRGVFGLTNLERDS